MITTETEIDAVERVAPGVASIEGCVIMSEQKSQLAGEIAYPAEFHFRVICDADAGVSEAIMTTALKYRVTGELRKSNASSTGRFQAFSISLVFQERTEMISFDREVKAIPGVRMLL